MLIDIRDCKNSVGVLSQLAYVVSSSDSYFRTVIFCFQHDGFTRHQKCSRGRRGMSSEMLVACLPITTVLFSVINGGSLDKEAPRAKNVGLETSVQCSLVWPRS